ncbi:hypothetical protein [Streptomyces sp. NPDC001380]|uniref:hypothetical protein n=1 Tax=Streptomyces sp. NPDC001380 TaxID=3364566 RepID=UPI00369B6A34
MSASPPPASPPPVPAHWPADVYPPGTTGWQRTAVRWLWQFVPAGYRRHDVLHEQPVLLALLAVHEADASREAAARAAAVVREHPDVLPVPALADRVVRMLEEEGGRLAGLVREAESVASVLTVEVRRRTPA